MKNLVMGGIAAVSAVVFCGCQMCTAPIPGDPSCVEDTHVRGIETRPGVVEYSKPLFAPTKDVFRPVYKAGTHRVSAVGAGISLEDATADAISKILLENNCDYIVSVTRVITKNTHPSGLFRFPITNYTVKIAGLPIYLDKLEKEEKIIVDKPVCKCPTKEELQAFIESLLKKYKPCTCPVVPSKPQAPAPAMALVHLTDINLSMTAKAASKDPVALAVPPPMPPKNIKK